HHLVRLHLYLQSEPIEYYCHFPQADRTDPDIPIHLHEMDIPLQMKTDIPNLSNFLKRKIEYDLRTLKTLPIFCCRYARTLSDHESLGFSYSESPDSHHICSMSCDYLH